MTSPALTMPIRAGIEFCWKNQVILKNKPMPACCVAIEVTLRGRDCRLMRAGTGGSGVAWVGTHGGSFIAGCPKCRLPRRPPASENDVVGIVGGGVVLTVFAGRYVIILRIAGLRRWCFAPALVQCGDSVMSWADEIWRRYVPHPACSPKSGPPLVFGNYVLPR